MRNHIRLVAASVVALALAAGLAIAGCSGGSTETAPPAGSQQDGGWKTITAEEAKGMMDADESAVILDVRSAEEFAEGHIPGAVLLPHTDITDETAAQAIPGKDTVVLVYCRSGNRSATASATLAGLGYTQVYDFGGIRDWPYDVVTD